MVVNGHRETPVGSDSVCRSVNDDKWQTVQPGPFSENQA